MVASCQHIVLAIPAQNKATANYIVVVVSKISCALLPKYFIGKTNIDQFPFARKWVSLCRHWVVLSNRGHPTDKYTSNVKTIYRSAIEKHTTHVAEQVE